jgi:hypothetical protein
MTKARELLQGYDASGANGLWITDGTVAGTIELAVSGSDPGGLFANITQIADFTVLGRKILFAGDDASGHYNLWETGGTAAGTIPIPVSGAYSSGLFYSITDLVDTAGGFNPHFTVFGNKALFVGTDANGHDTLGNQWNISRDERAGSLGELLRRVVRRP